MCWGFPFRGRENPNKSRPLPLEHLPNNEKLRPRAAALSRPRWLVLRGHRHARRRRVSASGVAAPPLYAAGSPAGHMFEEVAPDLKRARFVRRTEEGAPAGRQGTQNVRVGRDVRDGPVAEGGSNQIKVKSAALVGVASALAMVSPAAAHPGTSTHPDRSNHPAARAIPHDRTGVRRTTWRTSTLGLSTPRPPRHWRRMLTARGRVRSSST
jgi:hypothetical protein